MPRLPVRLAPPAPPPPRRGSALPLFLAAFASVFAIALLGLALFAPS